MSSKSALSIQNFKKKLFQNPGSVPERYSPEYYWSIQLWKAQPVDKTFTSEIFQLAGIDLGFRIKLTEDNSERLTLSIKFENPTEAKRRLSLFPKSFPNITVTIKDPIEEDKKDRTLIRTFQPGFNQQLNYDDWQLFHAIQYFNVHPLCKFNHFHGKNGIINVKILVESLREAKYFTSNNGVLLWKVDNYEETKRKAVNGYEWAIESRYFYTNITGYRMKIKIRLAKGVLTNVCFLTGEYDEMLSEHFPHRLTLMAINPANQGKFLMTSVCKQTAESYCLNFPHHPDLMNEGIVHDDSVIFKIVVQPLS